jgi:hypothetical protein
MADQAAALGEGLSSPKSAEAPSAATTANGRWARDHVIPPPGVSVRGLDIVELHDGIDKLVAQAQRPASARIAARSARWSA